MEPLEKTLEKVELEGGGTKLTSDKPLYKGLRLVEDTVYMGGTSIKYWM